MIELSATSNARNPYLIAKLLAAQGLAVFPVRNKQPLTPRGVYSATSDLNVLAKMDGWGCANGCGLATGAASGVDVLDVDVRPLALSLRDRKEFSPPQPDQHDCVVNGFAALQALGSLPETLAAQTPSGGRHFYFQHVVGSRSRKLVADGSVEWFSDGKLVVVPPASGRAWLNDALIVEAPDWLKAMVLADRCAVHEGEGRNSSGPLMAARKGNAQIPRDVYLLIVRGMRSAEPRAQRRVRGLWANLAAKGQRRNDGLNYTAWQFAEFVESGELDGEVAARLLWEACKANGYLAKDGAEVVKEIITRVLSANK